MKIEEDKFIQGLVDYASSEEELDSKVESSVSSMSPAKAVPTQTVQQPPLETSKPPPQKTLSKREMLTTDTEFSSKLAKTDNDLGIRAFEGDADAQLMLANYLKLIEQFSINERGSNFPIESTDPLYYTKSENAVIVQGQQSAAAASEVDNSDGKQNRRSRWD